jgi:hypothetical protein
MFSSETNNDLAPFLGRMSDWPELTSLTCREQLPLNKHRSSNQQREKDRQQYGRYHPLANTEVGDIRHFIAPCRGGSAMLSVTDNSRGRAVITKI